MKTLGLIGGMSWASTALYYRWINEYVQQKLGGLHSAKLLLVSVDFHEIQRLQAADDWAGASHILVQAARTLQAAGADALVVCTNTMHKVAPQIEAAVDIPLLHIVDATAQAIQQANLECVGLLGTRFTMEQSFVSERLQRHHYVSVLTPPPADREIVHRVIFEELCKGHLLEASRAHYRRIIADLVTAGAQAVILGCTEITLLIQPDDASVPLFDTTRLHAEAAAAWALS
jgi:aspartate racemase